MNSFTAVYVRHFTLLAQCCGPRGNESRRFTAICCRLQPFWTGFRTWSAIGEIMETSRTAGNRLGCAALFALVGAVLSVLPSGRPVSAAYGPATAAPVQTASSQPQSRITGVSVAGSQPVGNFNRVAYIRRWGKVTGVVASGEKVHGLERWNMIAKAIITTPLNSKSLPQKNLEQTR